MSSTRRLAPTLFRGSPFLSRGILSSRTGSSTLSGGSSIFSFTPRANTVANAPIFEDTETIEDIKRRISTAVTDDYGDVWYKGGISAPKAYLVPPGTILVRVHGKGNSLSSWLMPLPEFVSMSDRAKGNLESFLRIWKERMNIAESSSTDGLEVSIFETNAPIATLKGKGLPVGSTYDLTHVDKLAPGSDAEQFYVPGIHPDQGSRDVVDATRGVFDGIVTEDLGTFLRKNTVATNL